MRTGAGQPCYALRMEHIWKKAERNLERSEESGRPLGDQSNDRTLPGKKGKQGQSICQDLVARLRTEGLRNLETFHVI